MNPLKNVFESYSGSYKKHDVLYNNTGMLAVVCLCFHFNLSVLQNTKANNF